MVLNLPRLKCPDPFQIFAGAVQPTAGVAEMAQPELLAVVAVAEIAMVSIVTVVAEWFAHN